MLSNILFVFVHHIPQLCVFEGAKHLGDGTAEVCYTQAYKSNRVTPKYEQPQQAAQEAKLSCWMLPENLPLSTPETDHLSSK